MESILLDAPAGGHIDEEQCRAALERVLQGRSLKRVLLLPPDLTRLHSLAGVLTAMAWQMLQGRAQVDILPALGTHAPMEPEELHALFGTQIPLSAYRVHDWRRDVVTLGTVPGELIERISEGRLTYDIAVQVNRLLLEDYDLILSLGQVVPHEVAGMANHAKNIFVGVGGLDMIHRTHFLGAVCGMEQALGNDHAPVRQVFDWAAERFLRDLPLVYALTVVRAEDGQDRLKGLYLGGQRDAFEAAVACSRRENIVWLDRPLQRAVCYMEPQEFRSFWLANKSIYRTRMAMADGGRLVVLAPAVARFGEDAGMDVLLRKYGYHGTDATLKAVRENADLGENLSAAAHLIHGSSEGRFEVVYAAPRISRQEVEAAGFGWMDWDEAEARYGSLVRDVHNDGFQADGEGEFYYIPNPALGLWRTGKP